MERAGAIALGSRWLLSSKLQELEIYGMMYSGKLHLTAVPL